MMRTWLTVAIMLLAQPIALFIAVHAFPGSRSGWIGLTVIGLAYLAVVAAILMSRWTTNLKVTALIGYTAWAVLSLPVVALMAACSVGDCI